MGTFPDPAKPDGASFTNTSTPSAFEWLSRNHPLHKGDPLLHCRQSRGCFGGDVKAVHGAFGFIQRYFDACAAQKFGGFIWGTDIARNFSLMGGAKRFQGKNSRLMAYFFIDDTPFIIGSERQRPVSDLLRSVP